MKVDGATSLMTLALALACGAGAVALCGATRPVRSARRSDEFQRIVGGLGLGPALDLSRCAPAFDPRVGTTCPERVGAVPAGDAFSPDHASAVFPP